MLHPARLACLLLVLLSCSPSDAAPPWKRAFRAHRDLLRANFQLQQANCSYPPKMEQWQKRQLKQYEQQLKQTYRALERQPGGVVVFPLANARTLPNPLANAAALRVRATQPVMAPSAATAVSSGVSQMGARQIIPVRRTVIARPATPAATDATSPELVPTPQDAPAMLPQPVSHQEELQPTPAKERPSADE